MKVVVKSAASTKNNVKPNTAKAQNAAAKRATVEAPRGQEPKKYNVARILDLFHAEGVDGSPAFMGDSINQAFCHQLFIDREEIAEANTHPVSGKYLTVLANRLYIWPLLGLSRNKTIYERAHSKKLAVKGRIADLEKLFGKKNVAILDHDTAAELTKKHKTEKASKIALFGKQTAAK